MQWKQEILLGHSVESQLWHCSLYCQLGVEPPVLSFVSSVCPGQKMHPHSMMRYSPEKAALCQVYGLWRETLFISQSGS